MSVIYFYDLFKLIIYPKAHPGNYGNQIGSLCLAQTLLFEALNRLQITKESSIGLLNLLDETRAVDVVDIAIKFSAGGVLFVVWWISTP